MKKIFKTRGKYATYKNTGKIYSGCIITNNESQKPTGWHIQNAERK